MAAHELYGEVAEDGCILHVVGCVTDEVFSFLGPAARALAEAVHAQVIIVIDEPKHRLNVLQLDQHARVVRVPKTDNVLEQWRAVFAFCVREVRKDEIVAIHMHGVLPCVIASFAMRSAGARAPMVYSPHGSRSLRNFRLIGNVAMQLARSPRRDAIVTVPSEAVAIQNSELVDSPVHDAFFSTPRHEADVPLIVSGGRQNSPRSFDVFSQLAVLLGGEDLALGFRWIGSASDASIDRLAAAEVAVVEPFDEQACANELTAGWVYVAPWHTRGFPLFLVQAMAAGLPCVAFDCEQHRDVIEDGLNGYLCSSEQEMVRRIAGLVDDASLRLSIGSAARQIAAARFTAEGFAEKLLQFYFPRTRPGLPKTKAEAAG